MSSFDYRPYEAPSERAPRSTEHSRLGMASLAIGMLVGLFEFVLVIVAGVIRTTTPGGMAEDSTQAALIGLGVLAGLAIDVIGLILGLAGLFESGRNRLFAVLGLGICSMVLLAVALLVIIGLMAG